MRWVIESGSERKVGMKFAFRRKEERGGGRVTIRKKKKKVQKINME